MCLIALSDTRFEELSEAFWQQACAYNRHGFGLMYHDGDGLQIRGHLAYDHDTVRAESAAVPGGVKAAIHLRNATFGSREEENLHPQVLTFSEGAFLALAVMHNGCLPSMHANRNAGPSDTSLLVHGWLRQQLQANPAKWCGGEVQRQLANIVGPNNRLVLLDSEGNWRRIGAEQGFEVGRTWVSNMKSKAWLTSVLEPQAELF